MMDLYKRFYDLLEQRQLLDRELQAITAEIQRLRSNEETTKQESQKTVNQKQG